MKELFDIAQHKLVPKHVLLSKEEGQNVLKKYNISASQLPKISKKDPALAGLQVQQGDIIKIVRKSQTAGEATYFRVVMHD